MPKPDLPEWAVDTNYPAGAEPEAGTPTKVAPTSSQADIGWRPGAKPPAQEMNHWQNLVHQNFEYLYSILGDAETISFFPRPHVSTNWTAAANTSSAFDMYLESSGAATAYICLSDYMWDGSELESVSLWVSGDGAVDITAEVLWQDWDLPTVGSESATATNPPGPALTLLSVPITSNGGSFPSDQLNRLWLKLTANAAAAKVYSVIIVLRTT